MFEIELTVLSGPSEGDVLRYKLNETQSISLGRGRNSDVVVYDSQASVSHALIKIHDGSPYLIDLESKEGTWLMGFEVPHGPMGLPLGSGEEFRIGQMLFRASYKRIEETEERQSETTKHSPNHLETSAAKWKGRQGLIIALSLILLLLLLLWPESTSRTAHQSEAPLPMGVPRVIGYSAEGSSASLRDLAHPRSASFTLAPADQVVEFQIKNQAAVAVFVGSFPVIRISPSENSWQRWSVVIRDEISGSEPLLVFKNTANGSSGPREKSWALWNVRDTRLSKLPLSKANSIELDFERKLYSAAATADSLSGAPNALHLMLRSLQRLIVLALADIDQATIAYPVPSISNLEAPLEVKDKLLSIAESRTTARSMGTEVPLARKSKDIETLVSLAQAYDSELWQLYHNRIQHAKLAAKAKNYGDALRNLYALKAAFSDHDDYRYQEADALLKNKKVIPRKILSHSSRYLKESRR